MASELGSVFWNGCARF